MDSLENDVVCGDHDIADHIPDPEGGLTHYEDAVELALARVREGELQTRWSRDADDNSPSRRCLPTHRGPADRCTSRRVNAAYTPTPKRSGRFSSRLAPSMAGRPHRWRGA
jgi:hypothetical protein